MYVEAYSEDKKEKFSAEIPSVTSEVLSMIAELDYSDGKMKAVIERLDISADAKSLIFAIAKTTIRVGSTIVKIGRKIIDCILNVFEEFPNAGFGVIFGATLGFLIGAIPVIGVALGSLAVPVLTGMGLTLGLKQDIQDRALVNRVATINNKFEYLKSKEYEE